MKEFLRRAWDVLLHGLPSADTYDEAVEQHYRDIR